MTGFETIYILNEMEDTMWMHIMNYISIIFAMLVTAYFIASKLNQLMSWALVTLFTMGAALFFGSAISARLDYVTMANHARDTLAAGNAGLPTLNMFAAPGATVVGMDVALYVILALAYLATMVFFFQARKQGGGITIEAT